MKSINTSLFQCVIVIGALFAASVERAVSDQSADPVWPREKSSGAAVTALVAAEAVTASAMEDLVGSEVAADAGDYKRSNETNPWLFSQDQQQTQH